MRNNYFILLFLIVPKLTFQIWVKLKKKKVIFIKLHKQFRLTKHFCQLHHFTQPRINDVRSEGSVFLSLSLSLTYLALSAD